MLWPTMAVNTHSCIDHRRCAHPWRTATLRTSESHCAHPNHIAHIQITLRSCPILSALIILGSAALSTQLYRTCKKLCTHGRQTASFHYSRPRASTAACRAMLPPRQAITAVHHSWAHSLGHSSPAIASTGALPPACAAPRASAAAAPPIYSPPRRRNAGCSLPLRCQHACRLSPAFELDFPPPALPARRIGSSAQAARVGRVDEAQKQGPPPCKRKQTQGQAHAYSRSNSNSNDPICQKGSRTKRLNPAPESDIQSMQRRLYFVVIYNDGGWLTIGDGPTGCSLAA